MLVAVVSDLPSCHSQSVASSCGAMEPAAAYSLTVSQKEKVLPCPCRQQKLSVTTMLDGIQDPRGQRSITPNSFGTVSSLHCCRIVKSLAPATSTTTSESSRLYDGAVFVTTIAARIDSHGSHVCVMVTKLSQRSPAISAAGSCRVDAFRHVLEIADEVPQHTATFSGSTDNSGNVRDDGGYM